MKKKRLILKIIIIVVIIMGATLLSYMHYIDKYNLYLDKKVNTFNMLRKMSSHLQCYEVDNPDADLAEYFKYYYDELPDSFEIMADIYPGHFDLNTWTIYDFWGNPIVLMKDMEGKLQLVSFGPNGKNDHGEGDDVTHSFKDSTINVEDRKRD